METCFGFFGGEGECRACPVAKKCKSLLVSDGFDLAAAVLEELIRTLPEDGTYVLTPEIEAFLEDPASRGEDVKRGLEQLFSMLVSGGSAPPGDPAGVEHPVSEAGDALA